jgi:hypothetical protein
MVLFDLASLINMNALSFTPPNWDWNAELGSHHDIGFRCVDSLHAINIHFHRKLAWYTKEIIWAHTFLVFWFHTPYPCCPLNNMLSRASWNPYIFALWYKEVPKIFWDDTYLCCVLSFNKIYIAFYLQDIFCSLKSFWHSLSFGRIISLPSLPMLLMYKF